MHPQPSACLVSTIGGTGTGLKDRLRLPTAASSPARAGDEILAGVILPVKPFDRRAGGALAALVASAVVARAVLVRASGSQSSQLFEAAVDAEISAARERLGAAAQRRRLHDAANALTAIDGAATILRDDLDTLSNSDRSVLAGVLGSGIDSLRRILAEDDAAEKPVSLAEAVATVDRERGAENPIDHHLSPDLTACGPPGQIEEVLRQLLRHAGGEGGSGPIRVTGHRGDLEVVLRIEGCRLPMNGVRGSVLVDENRPPPAWNNAIGVYVADRLIREQEGSLWVEARPGAQPSYAIHLKSGS